MSFDWWERGILPLNSPFKEDCKLLHAIIYEHRLGRESIWGPLQFLSKIELTDRLRQFNMNTNLNINLGPLRPLCPGRKGGPCSQSIQSSSEIEIHQSVSFHSITLSDSTTHATYTIIIYDTTLNIQVCSDRTPARLDKGVKLKNFIQLKCFV